MRPDPSMRPAGGGPGPLQAVDAEPDRRKPHLGRSDRRKLYPRKLYPSRSDRNKPDPRKLYPGKPHRNKPDPGKPGRFEPGDPSIGRPRVPRGFPLELAGRGTTFVRQLRDPGATDRPTLVLLHGWSTTAALNWFRVYEPLAEFADVVSLDHRGHGRGIRSGSRFRLVDAADDVAALLHTLAIADRRVVLVGYSMGGAVAQLVARRHAGLIDGLVLAATWTRMPPRTRQTGLLHAAGRVATIAKPLSPRRGRALLALGVRAASGNRSTNRGQWLTEEIASAHLPSILEASGEMARFDSRGWLSDFDPVTGPVVGIAVTTRDQVVSAGTQHLLAAHLPQAEIADIPTVHEGCVTQPDVFAPPFVDLVHGVVRRVQLRRVLQTTASDALRGPTRTRRAAGRRNEAETTVRQPL